MARALTVGPPPACAVVAGERRAIRRVTAGDEVTSAPSPRARRPVVSDSRLRATGEAWLRRSRCGAGLRGRQRPQGRRGRRLQPGDVFTGKDDRAGGMGEPFAVCSDRGARRAVAPVATIAAVPRFFLASCGTTLPRIALSRRTPGQRSRYRGSGAPVTPPLWEGCRPTFERPG
jgi:hypothetical protein